MNNNKQFLKFSRSFSLRSLFLAFTVLACVFGFYSYESNRQRLINASIAKIRDAGAVVFSVNSRQQCTAGADVKPITLGSVFTRCPTFVGVIELSDPALTEKKIRELIPDMAALVGTLSSRTKKRRLFIDLIGNPNITPDLVSDLETDLPNCRLCRYTSIPPDTVDAIQIGMPQEEVARTIGALIYNQRPNRPGNKPNEIRMFGLYQNAKYENSKGLETWTYFTDDFGVGVIGVSFDANDEVVSVWTDRGIVKSRGLTRKLEMVGGL